MPSSHKRILGVLSIGVPYFGVAPATQHLVATRELLEPHYHLVGPAEIVVGKQNLFSYIFAGRK